MKKNLLLLFLLVSALFANAQNIGIGTTTPLAKLHISTGPSGNITPFSPLVVEGNSNTFINLLSPNTNETGLLFGKADNAASGAIVYNNVNTLNGFQFRTNGNITQMILNSAGNLGIGISTPNAKLSISANGTELVGTASGNIFRTNAGNLGSTAGDELSLANIGFLSTNNSSLGIRAYRSSAGTDWNSTALLLGYDVDNTVRAGGGLIALSANGNIGIRTSTPDTSALLHVDVGTSTTKGILISGTFSGSGTIPNLGAGTRMMFYPGKAAFRSGYVSGTQWDNSNVGFYSTAMGSGTIASGDYSTAMGINTNASATWSTAMGYSTTASGLLSTAMGEQTSASGNESMAMGFQTTASGSISTAMGNGTIASGVHSTSMGIGTLASGYTSMATGSFTDATGNYSTAMGEQTTASGDYSTAMGESTTAKSGYETVFGRWNTDYTPLSTNDWNAADRLFAIGNGTSSSSRSDAITILKNGNTGIGINNPNAPLAFTNNTGKKISLYESSPNSQYGFAVQPSQLQIYSDNTAAKISFGYYVSGIFTERMYLTNSTGILTVAGTSYPSDARYKKQITRLQNPLEKIMAINGVEYFMRTDEFTSKHFETKLQVGLIAQEVEKVLPQAVQTGEDGYKAIDYARVVPLLVEAIKEQQKQIDELKKLVREKLAP